MGEQYALRARAGGITRFTNGAKVKSVLHIYTEATYGKLGTTIDGADRYSNSFLLNTGGGVTCTPEFMSTIDQLIFVERMKLLNYAIQNDGTLPPGNTKL